jgi:hypothetical protein
MQFTSLTAGKADLPSTISNSADLATNLTSAFWGGVS